MVVLSVATAFSFSPLKRGRWSSYEAPGLTSQVRHGFDRRLSVMIEWSQSEIEYVVHINIRLFSITPRLRVFCVGHFRKENMASKRIQRLEGHIQPGASKVTKNWGETNHSSKQNDCQRGILTFATPAYLWTFPYPKSHVYMRYCSVVCQTGPVSGGGSFADGNVVVVSALRTPIGKAKRGVGGYSNPVLLMRQSCFYLCISS